MGLIVTQLTTVRANTFPWLLNQTSRSCRMLSRHSDQSTLGMSNYIALLESSTGIPFAAICMPYGPAVFHQAASPCIASPSELRSISPASFWKRGGLFLGFLDLNRGIGRSAAAMPFWVAESHARVNIVLHGGLYSEPDFNQVASLERILRLGTVLQDEVGYINLFMAAQEVVV